MTTDELRHVHEAGLRVLGSTGVVFESEDIVRRFRAAGFSTDGYCVVMRSEAPQPKDEVQGGISCVAGWTQASTAAHVGSLQKPESHHLRERSGGGRALIPSGASPLRPAVARREIGCDM